ncbi:MAG: AfsR family transcriptional regulator [Actinomycetia bacterium]|nr:AfsR family transcriptional regulator [Actinomycetes bacterium]
MLDGQGVGFMRTGLRFGILGGLVVYDGDRPLPLGPFKQRVVLAMLLCRPNQVVSVAALTDALWDDDPPRTAHKNLQVYVSALRRALGSSRDGRIARVATGYRLEVDPDQLDLLRFHDLARAGREVVLGGDNVAAAQILGEAVRLWRGSVFPDLTVVPALAAEAKRLDEGFLDVYESWAEAMVEVGRHAELLDSLMDVARQHPFRERLRHAQLLTLYRAGRQNEALAQFDGLRQALARDLGLAPSPVLTRLYKRILGAHGDLDAPVAATVQVTHPGLDREIVDFTGRDGYLAELVGLLGTGRVVVVSGAVGVGKTTLAVHAAHRFAELYPDGRTLIRLRRPDGTSIRVIDELRSVPDGRSLVVLDDAGSEAQIRPLLAAIPERCDVMVTSRRHLAGLEGACHIGLEPMPESEALMLLGRLVGADRIAAEPRTARRLISACGGLPLALRIVGARLASLRHLRLDRYAERLSDESRVLDELVAGDLSLRDRLAEAFRDLTPEEGEVLRVLAHQTGLAFSASDVAPALGLEPARAEIVLERLVEAHVVMVPADSYHDLVNDEADEVVAHAIGQALAEPCFEVPWLIRSYVRELNRR